MSFVSLSWCATIPWKMQSILESTLRGPDQMHCPRVKIVNRWMRIVSRNNADPSKPYMAQSELPTDLEVCEELAYLSCHFVHHFADALRVIAVFHPQNDIRGRAWKYHYRIAEELFHFVPENDDEFVRRHRDKVEHD